MGLIRHQDYKSRARSATMNLALHDSLMVRREAKGVPRLKASSQAMKMLQRIPFKKRAGLLTKMQSSGQVYVKGHFRKK